MAETFEEFVAGGWDPHPQTIAMKAPKEYPKGSAQFDPKTYLMHSVKALYIGPFVDGDDARRFKEQWAPEYFVVRTSKPRDAASPDEFVAVAV